MSSEETSPTSSISTARPKLGPGSGMRPGGGSLRPQRRASTDADGDDDTAATTATTSQSWMAQRKAAREEGEVAERERRDAKSDLATLKQTEVALQDTRAALESAKSTAGTTTSAADGGITLAPESAADRARKREEAKLKSKSATPIPVGEHPLQNAWAVWYDKAKPKKRRDGGATTAGWEGGLKVVGAFQDVEYMWRWFNSLTSASDMDVGANYHVFKEGVKPMWEAPANKGGGSWTIRFAKRTSGQCYLQEYWLNLVCAAVGETLDEGANDICGVGVSKRRSGDKLVVWMSAPPSGCSAEEEETRAMEIGRRVKSLCNADVAQPMTGTMDYKLHEASKSYGGSALTINL